MSRETSLTGLLELQSIDMRIAELTDRGAQILLRRAEVAREITAHETEKTALEGAIERGRLARRGHESELEAEEERRQRYERQLNEVKTNVAYSALLTEIQGVRRRVGELEEAILGLMEERESHENRIAEIAAELIDKRAAAADELSSLADEESRNAAELAEEQARRQGRITGIDPLLYRLYDRLRKGRRFPALVPLRGQACGSCHGRLPPQIVREIIHSTSIHPCENCGVLVYCSQSIEDSTAPEDVKQSATPSG